MKSATRNAAIVLALLVPGSAFASSDQAWSQFAKDVEQKCTAAAEQMFRKPQIVVDPTGTENYGVAIVFGRSKEAKARSTVICVMDKKTGKVELGSELSKDVVRVRVPKPGEQDAKGAQQKQSSAQGQNKMMDKSNAASQDDGEDDQQ